MVPPYYDSLLGKLIVSGNTRDEAISRAKNALAHMVIEGVHTTRDFLAEIVRDDHFVAGDVDTHFIERFMERRAESAGD